MSGYEAGAPARAGPSRPVSITITRSPSPGCLLRTDDTQIYLNPRRGKAVDQGGTFVCPLLVDGDDLLQWRDGVGASDRPPGWIEEDHWVELRVVACGIIRLKRMGGRESARRVSVCK